MKKALKILLIVDACVAVAFLIGYEIMEVLLLMPFSKDSSFELTWNIFFYGMQITSTPLVIIFTIYYIKFLIKKCKK